MSENWIKTLSVYQIPDEEAVDFDVGNNKKIAIDRKSTRLNSSHT